MKKIMIIKLILVFLLIIMLCVFIASFSFDKIYYNKKYDSVIIFNNSNITYRYNEKNKSITGNLDIKDGKIIFVNKEKRVATGIYYHKNKTIIIDGKFLNNKYNETKFKQVESIFTYIKAVF